MAEQTEYQKVEETLNPNAHGKSLNTAEATLESDCSALCGTESTITNHNAAETSAPASDVDREKSLEYADELLQQGYKEMKENDFSEAAENFSRALEIRLRLHFFFFVAMKSYFLPFLWNLVPEETARNRNTYLTASRWFFPFILRSCFLESIGNVHLFGHFNYFLLLIISYMVFWGPVLNW